MIDRVDPLPSELPRFLGGLARFRERGVDMQQKAVAVDVAARLTETFDGEC